MNNKNKLKSENGSAMVLAIIVIVLASLTMLILTKQVINQIKLTHKTNTSIEKDYVKQADIERGIGDFISKISVEDIKEDSETPEANYKAPKGIVYREIRLAKAKVLEAQVLNNSKIVRNGHIDGEDTIYSSLDRRLGNNLEYIEDEIDRLEGLAINSVGEYPTDSSYINRIINKKSEMKNILSNIDDKIEDILDDKEYKKNNNLDSDSKKNITASLLAVKQIVVYMDDALANLVYSDYDSNLISGKSSLNNSIDDLENDMNLSLEYLEFMKDNVDFNNSNFKTIYIKIKEEGKFVWKEYSVEDFIDHTIELLNGTKGELQDLRDTIDDMNNQSYEVNQRSVIIIATRLNSLYHEVGFFNFEEESMQIFNKGVLKTDSNIYKDYGANKSGYLLKTYAQGLRRSLKETQVQSKLIQYQTCKYFLNGYVENNEIEDEIKDDIIKNHLNIIENSGLSNFSNIIKDVKQTLDEICTNISSFDYLKDYSKYDTNIKNIVNKLDYSVTKLAEINKVLAGMMYSNSYKGDSKIATTYRASEESINSLRKLRLIFNSVYSEGPKTPENIPDQGQKKITYADRNILPNIKVTDIKTNGIDLYGTQQLEGQFYSIKVNKNSNVEFTINNNGAKVLVKLEHIKDKSNYQISYQILEL
ncbi:hypothetical protein [Paraclostridium bifermentans]|uniref:hypothetical protein n=1 Tax=Paraclostridium bifermentans TaxID=1490 RepID=UPI00359C329A